MVGSVMAFEHGRPGPRSVFTLSVFGPVPTWWLDLVPVAWIVFDILDGPFWYPDWFTCS